MCAGTARNGFVLTLDIDDDDRPRIGQQIRNNDRIALARSCRGKQQHEAIAVEADKATPFLADDDAFA